MDEVSGNKHIQGMIDLLLRDQPLLLAGHEDPDGDCLGSLLGLYHAFRGEEKGWAMLLNDPIPANLTFLPGLERMLSPDQVDFSRYPAILLVDCGDPARCGAYLPPLAQGRELYCIDHHISNDFHGALAVVEPEAAAAGEIIAALCEQAGIKPGPEAALCLYIAMASDTGGFRYNNTTGRCLRLAGDLRPQVDIERVRVHLFEDRSWANLKMMAACLNNIQVECEGRLAYSFLSREERERWQAAAEDCHNIVNYTLVLSGVKVGLIFEEYEGYVKMSFRCRGGYRVDQLAASFGGGGHLLAAGCKQEGSLEQVMARVLPAARRLLD